ncbi:FxsA family protein [Pseudoalteromonas tunicata]|jgi:UPF0716 protein FxsA|uniref:Putative FxsA protein n=1 Tax=Pseudoalteromonas tunicata D2 TaxID=87626 RepID=A4CEJ5_9GAMM|nr:FxsA family protein [Pseudoalteromonas tunicata]ATC95988.1 UPF0716 protein FxsA [Pseudoalteromonas tunicata]AXT31521.1 FxsA family protein [Pseudoalteromonas tunicata]EAR26724.1 putative FxsA protein [Pseudoalteromonas tunicata D2]
MFKALFVLFIIVPIIEIALLIQVSDVIGGWSTIALVILTAFIGAKLVKQQGISALQNAQLQMAQGQMPTNELLAGVCIIIAGVLLLTPGIMTDIFGLLLLVPAVRAKLASQLGKNAHMKMGSQNSGFYYQQHSQQQSNVYESEEYTEIRSERISKTNSTIEGEFQRKE